MVQIVNAVDDQYLQVRDSTRIEATVVAESGAR